ncbi:MAG: hypothetical protein HY696_07730 [Deltaproteobacteria bacterium]|nr:hypothetical protein [Deltaproteobacteria bacterium]
MIAPRHEPQPHWCHPVCCAAAAAPPPGLVLLEIGPGNGAFLDRLATAHPDRHLIGIELCWQRFIQQQHRCARHGNVSLYRGNARRTLPLLAQAYPCATIYINFPDPWPKRKHARNRLLQPDFLTLCAASLAPQGELFITTDDHAYAQTVARLAADTPQLRNRHVTSWVTHDASAFATYFATKWQRLGRTIYYQHYEKTVRTCGRESLPD